MNLNRAIFWDTDFETIDWNFQRGEVIERVLHYGDLPDWMEILRFYGYDVIRIEVTKRRHLDKKVLSFCSNYFNLPLNQFRCFNIEPSIRQHWNY